MNKYYFKNIVIPALLIFAIISSGFILVDSDKDSEKQITLQSVAPFKIGTSVDFTLLDNNIKYRNTVINEFNSLTAENGMKMNRIENEQGIFNWKEADDFIAFAQKNNKRIHGHTLVWHRAVPVWVEKFSGDSTAWENLLKQYITIVVTHFKGKVTSWDVVNEAIEDDGSYRQNIWFQHLGKDYIAKAFNYAHTADPNVLLFYNDYWQERSPTKRIAIKNLLLELKAKGIPVNGVGMQMHTSIWLKKTDIEAAVTAMSQTGLLVHISELTITVNPNRGNQSFVQNETSKQQQMEKFAEIITAYKTTVPQKQQYGITFWNVGDKDSYIPRDCKCKDYPQIFDTSYNKKDYYSKIIDALKIK